MKKQKIIRRAVKLRRVVDGDTASFDINLGLGVYLQDCHCRIAGIDTPERGREGFYDAKREFEALLPKHAFLADLEAKRDKYGRVIMHLPAIVEYMISQGFGKRYGK